MNDNERNLLRYICTNNMRKSQELAKFIIESEMTTAKDKRLKGSLLEELAKNSAAEFMELPTNIKGILVAEDPAMFQADKYYPKKAEESIVKKTKSIYKAAELLKENGLHFLPSVLLYGESGCGKTELARYIAYCLNLPFFYVRFSNLVESYLGNTQKNLARVFDYAKKFPCVLCFDEIDAIGTKRSIGEVGEMKRIVISLMQELDSLNNDIVFIGTTNRFDILDEALIRRFTLKSEIKKLPYDEVVCVSKAIFSSVNISTCDDVEKWCYSVFGGVEQTAAHVYCTCVEKVVESLTEGEETEQCTQCSLY